MGNWDHVEITCYRSNCHAMIALHRSDYERLKRTHDTFYCAQGHGQCFSGDTEEEKKIKRLESQLDSWSMKWQRAHETVDAMVEGAIVCPLGCGFKTRRHLPMASRYPWRVGRFYDRVYGDLRDHLLREHNATLAPVALIPEKAQSSLE